MYKLIKDSFDKQIRVVYKLSESLFIPMDESNRHYQEYLKWLAEGNTPEPADSE
jgi:hypothetical protein